MIRAALGVVLACSWAATAAAEGGSRRAAPVLSSRAFLELQIDSNRLLTSLAQVHSLALSGVPPAELEAPKRAIIRDMDQVLSQLTIALPTDREAMSSRLREIRAERTALESAQAKADSAAARHRLIELNEEIYALQIRNARLQLKGKSSRNPPALRRNAALWSLLGAFNSAAAGHADAGWMERPRTTVSIAADGTTVIVSGRWNNAHTAIETAAQDARNDRVALARQRLAGLAAKLRRTSRPDVHHLNRHDEAAAALEALATDKSAAKDPVALSAQALAIKDLLPHPKILVPTAIPYTDPATAARSRKHAVERIRNKDFVQTLKYETLLTRWSLALFADNPRAKVLVAARAAVAEVHTWMARNIGDEFKQLAAQNLEAALAALDAGDVGLAARQIVMARDELPKLREHFDRVASAMEVSRRRLSR